MELNLLPVNRSSQGYLFGVRNQSTASWGGQAVFDGGLYHLIYADFDKGCGLNCWGTNSQIARAVSSSPTGPFRKVQVVAPPFHHNPTINKVPNGGPYVIVSIGNGTVVPPHGDVRVGDGDAPQAGIITMLYADKSKMVMLSRFVVLSVSLTLRASLLQSRGRGRGGPASSSNPGLPPTGTPK